jgi:hypothetical protein
MEASTLVQGHHRNRERSECLGRHAVQFLRDVIPTEMLIDLPGNVVVRYAMLVDHYFPFIKKTGCTEGHEILIDVRIML